MEEIEHVIREMKEFEGRDGFFLLAYLFFIQLKGFRWKEPNRSLWNWVTHSSGNVCDWDNCGWTQGCRYNEIGVSTSRRVGNNSTFWNFVTMRILMGKLNLEFLAEHCCTGSKFSTEIFTFLRRKWSRWLRKKYEFEYHEQSYLLALFAIFRLSGFLCRNQKRHIFKLMIQHKLKAFT